MPRFGDNPSVLGEDFRINSSSTKRMPLGYLVRIDHVLHGALKNIVSVSFAGRYTASDGYNQEDKC